jgi:hypothetical protein
VSNSILVRVDSTVGEIVDNTVTGSGDSGILIANEAEVGRTAGNLIARNNKGLSVLSNSRLRKSESDLIEYNQRIGLEVVDATLDELTDGAIIRNGADTVESGNGIQVRGDARALIRNTDVHDNFGQGGAYASGGASLIFENVEFDRNERHGVEATDSETIVELRDSGVFGTRRFADDDGFGVMARQGATVRCVNTVIEGNEGGAVFAATGAAEGCE